MTSFCRLSPGFLGPFVCLLLMVAGARADTEQLAGKIERTILEPIAREAPGAAAVLVLDGKVVRVRTWGARSAEARDQAINDRTLFRVASISKTFAGTAGAMLVREAEIDWKTPIARELEGLRFKKTDWGEQINLQHVLSQSTGLMPHAYTNLIEDNQSFERIVGKLHNVDFICAPGECYSYQNVVFSLVGEVVEKATGMPYPQYVEDRIFGPLGMTRASIGYRKYVDDANHARPHVWTGESWAPTRITLEYYRVPPAAGVNASISDMRRWLQAQLGDAPDVLSPSLLAEVQAGIQRTSRQQSHYPRNRRLGEVHYGLGWRVFDYGGVEDFVHHGGYVRGMRSEMVFNRNLDAGLVFLTNSEPRKMGRIVFEFADMLIDDRASGRSIAAVD